MSCAPSIRTSFEPTRFARRTVALTAALAACGVLAGCDGVKPAAIPPEPDLSTHVLYSEYDFGETEDVIDVGIQPLWVPTCIITETMRRDAVLREALARRGLEIRFHSFLKGADVNFFLKRGDVEVAIGGDMPAITAAATCKVVVAALIQQGFVSIVARKHMLLTELKGRRIGYATGSNAHYALLQALASAELAEEDVRLIPLDVNQMPDALAEGTIDAFSAWEPTPTIALTRFEDQVVIHRSLTSGYLYFSRSFAENHAEAIRDVVAAELRATRWLQFRRQNLLEASRWAVEAGRNLAGPMAPLSPEQYVVLARNDLLGHTTRLAIPAADLAPHGRLAAEFQFLKGLGRISKKVGWNDVRSCFDRTIIQEVVSGGWNHHDSPADSAIRGTENDEFE